MRMAKTDVQFTLPKPSSLGVGKQQGKINFTIKSVKTDRTRVEPRVELGLLASGEKGGNPFITLTNAHHPGNSYFKRGEKQENTIV